MQNGPRTYNAASLRVVECVALPTRMRPQTREITDLETDPEAHGRGDATALMHQVCDEADAANITLVLWVRPFGDGGGLSRAQLISWYARRFGFAELPGDQCMMARMPCSTPAWLKPSAAAALEACSA